MSYLNSQSWISGMQGVSSKIDSTFGEQIRITPVEHAPNFQGAPQNERSVELLGVFSWRSELALKVGNSAFNKGENGGLVESRKPVVTFSRDALPWALQRGDIFTRLCSGDQFEATAIEPDGISRITVKLVQLGAQSQ